ncbi:MAG: hypothetical protein RLZZ450_1876 [Pseudomonadota bacterium]|jgi:metal-responsive CopG/Arc/MetJ family transcriptional regulator
MSGRLNARVDDELARKVEALSRATGKSASSIIEAALEAYIESARVCHLLAARLSVDAELAFVRSASAGAFKLVELELGHLERIQVLMDKYRDLRNLRVL